MDGFYVGGLVVALETFNRRPGVQDIPIKDRIYTIRDAAVYSNGTLGLRFKEIRNDAAKWCEGFIEVAFQSDYFRPVRPQSIEWAREIARDVKQPQRENA